MKSFILSIVFRWLVADAAAGDSLFMHYSGEPGMTFGGLELVGKREGVDGAVVACLVAPSVDNFEKTCARSLARSLTYSLGEANRETACIASDGSLFLFSWHADNSMPVLVCVTSF